MSTDVLLTGAEDNPGKVLRDNLSGEYDLLRLSDLGEMDPAKKPCNAIWAVPVR